MPPKMPKYGLLNDIDLPRNAKRITTENSIGSRLRDAIDSAYTPSSILNTGPYKGIVLRIENSLSKHSSLEAGNVISEYYNEIYDSPDKNNSEIVSVKVRIPELHAMLPVPNTIGKDSEDHEIIDMYPTFIGMSDEDIKIPTEGSLVWVDFGNRMNFSDPFYIGPVSLKATQPTQRANISPSEKHKKICNDSFNSEAPNGDTLFGQNKALSHTGEPLLPRKPFSRENIKIIKGDRFSSITVNRWEKALNSNQFMSKTWIGNLPSNGKNDQNHPSGKRDTIIFSPNSNDFSGEIELIYYFHDLKEFGNGYDFSNRFVKISKQMSEERRNFVLVIPELPWSYQEKNINQEQLQAWIGEDNFISFHKEVQNEIKKTFSNNLNIGLISIVGNGLGTSAIINIISDLNGNINPDRITISNANSSEEIMAVFNGYITDREGIEYNILVQKNSTLDKKLNDLESNIFQNNQNIYIEKLVNVNRRQMGDMVLSFVNPIISEQMERLEKQLIIEASENPSNEIDKEEPILEQQSPQSRRKIYIPDLKYPIANNSTISPSIIQKTSSVRTPISATISMAEVFKEARVKVSDFGTLESNSDLLVEIPSLTGNPQKLHILAAKRFQAMNEAWIAENPDRPIIRIASGHRKHRWKSREEYENLLIRKYKSVEKGRKWIGFASPHETGLAFDIGNNGLYPRSATNERQKQTRLYNWLKANAHRFGITPYRQEAWHWEVRVPRESYASGEEFTDNLAVRVENVGEADQFPTRLSSANQNCVITLGEVAS